MTVNNAVLAEAGALVMLSVLLGGSISPWALNENWLWLGAVVGLSLFQSAFTGFCPSAMIAKALGAKDK